MGTDTKPGSKIIQARGVVAWASGAMALEANPCPAAAGGQRGLFADGGRGRNVAVSK